MIEALRDSIGQHTATYLALGGLVIGCVFGAVVFATNFCAMGSLSDIHNFGDWRRFRAWVLAAAVALVGAQLLQAGGVVALDKSMYLAGSGLNWVGHSLGGLMFGFGMVFTGGCPSRNLARAGGGDLRSLLTLIALGLFAYMALGSVLAWWGRLDEAEAWVQRAERTVRAEADPAAALRVLYFRGQFELGRGRPVGALAAFRAAERLAGPYPVARQIRAWLLHALVRLGDTERAEQALAGLGEPDRDRGEMRSATAVLRLAQHDPHAATAALAPVLDGSAPVIRPIWLAQAFLLEAIARDALGDQAAAGHALERALDQAEPDRALLWFLLHPAPGLLERHARQRTAHAALIAQILDLLAGNRPAPRPAGSRPPLEPLSKSEIRVLRYLPTHLSAPEIAGELSVSTSTVKTHMRNLYAKLGVHSRAEAVESARSLGLLAPSARSR